MLRQPFVLEDRLVREIGDVIDAGDWWHRWFRPGGDDDMSRSDHEIASDNLTRADEARPGTDALNPEALEPLRRIMRGNRVDHAAHVLVHGAEVDGRVSAYPEAAACARAVRRLRGGKQRFRRYT